MRLIGHAVILAVSLSLAPLAGEVVSRSATGRKYHAVIAGIGRPHRSAPSGVALLILVEDHGASDAEVANYAREVLGRDRQVSGGQ